MSFKIPKIGTPRMPAMPTMRRSGRSVRQVGGSGRIGVKEHYVGGTAPLKPEWFTGTQPEWAVWWALERLHLKPNLDFEYIVAIAASRGVSGYTEADFVVFPYSVAIMVNGEYFHYEQGGQKQAHDRIQYAVIASSGLIPVVIDAEDANRNPIYFTKEALAGRTHSRVRGLF